MQRNDGWTEMSRFDGVGVPLSIGWVHEAPAPSVATLRDRLRRAWTLLCVTPWSRPPACQAAPWCREPRAGCCTVFRAGRLAQGESASFTPKRSLVRSQYRPPAQTPPSDLRRGRLTTGSDNNAGARARALAISYCHGGPLRWSPDQRAGHVVVEGSAGTSRAVAAVSGDAPRWCAGPIRRIGLGRRPIRIGNCARCSARGTPDRTPGRTSQR